MPARLELLLDFAVRCAGNDLDRFDRDLRRRLVLAVAGLGLGLVEDDETADPSGDVGVLQGRDMRPRADRASSLDDHL